MNIKTMLDQFEPLTVQIIVSMLNVYTTVPVSYYNIIGVSNDLVIII